MPGSPDPATIPAVLHALESLARLGAGSRADPEEIRRQERLTRRLGTIALELLGFLADMWRGMEEFRRAYRLPSAADEPPARDPGELAGRLLDAPGDEGVTRSLGRWIQELKVHHAALLEAYQEATTQGSRSILSELDPVSMKREMEGGPIRVGPLRVSSSWRPVLVQAIWEEYLRRFRKLSSLEASDYERYHREGFRQGYDRFVQASRLRSSGAAGEPAE